MKEKFLLFLVLICSISCEPTQDFKGEIIPEQKYISSLLTVDKSQNQQVISYLNQIIDDESSSYLYYLRAFYLYESRQYKKANVDIQKTLKSSPRDLEYLLLAGQIAYNLENYSSALNYFNLIKSNGKKQLLILFLLSDVSIKLNHYSAANYYLNQIKINDLSVKDQSYYAVLCNLCLTNSNPIFVKSMDPFFLQDVRLQRLYLENALDQTPKFQYQNQLLLLINRYPNDPHLVRFWARFLNRIGQFKMSELSYQKVVNLFEHNDKLYFEIAQFYIYHRIYTSALFYLNKIKPDLELFIDVPFLKSKCYLYLGDQNRYKSMIDSVQILLKNDRRFYQLKKKHFGISMDSTRVVSDSLLAIKP